MIDEEKAYQEFFVKTVQKGQEFADDYSKLSQRNQMRFWKDLNELAQFKAKKELHYLQLQMKCRYLMIARSRPKIASLNCNLK